MLYGIYTILCPLYVYPSLIIKSPSPNGEGTVSGSVKCPIFLGKVYSTSGSPIFIYEIVFDVYVVPPINIS